MSTHATTLRSFPHSPGHTRGSYLVVVTVVLLVVAAVLGGVVWFALRTKPEATHDDVLTCQVFRGPYEHIVLEQGQVESSQNVEIRCEVKSRSAGGTEILWVVDEGTHVKKGEKLVELDASALKREEVQQEIVCNTARASMIQAENTLEAARIARIEYIEGAYRQEEQADLSAIFVAEESLRRAQLAFKSTERLAAKGIVTALQLEGDQFAVEKAKNELDAARTKLDVLRKYTKEKNLKQFDSDIASAEAKWESEKKSYNLEQQKLDEIKEQIAKCTITATQGGQVVYANLVGYRGGSPEFLVQAGSLVRERQTIIRLPDPTKMQIKALINESRISLVQSGMPVDIRLDAVKDRVLHGIVSKVNQYAEPTNWHSGNIKEYAAFVDIHEPPAEIRTGMNAEVRVFVERREDALQVPVQAICETKGRHFCLLLARGRWETRELKVGSSNDTHMTIAEGLQEGETVVLNPRAHPQQLALPELPDEEPAKLAAATPPQAGRAPTAESAAKGSPAKTPAESAAGEPPSPTHEPFDPARLFASLDGDRDGRLSAKELAGLPPERRERIQRADANGDGIITRQEFESAMARFKPPTPTPPQASGGGA